MVNKCLERASILVALSLAIATPTAAEIYKRIDANGSVVFTDRIDTVPAAQRTPWELVTSGPQRFSQVSGPTESQPTEDVKQQLMALHADAEPTPSAWDDADVTRVRFQRSGSLMLVNVRLNDQVVAPFYVDSGCTGISITRAVAAQLGLDRKPVRRLTKTRTANGTVWLAKFQLDSVALGSIRVVDIAATINPHLTVGLLGASFLNQFIYTVDAASGVLILERRSS